MQPQEIIRRKRDGQVLSRDEIRAFVEGIVGGAVSPAQTGAFTMAVWLRGMTDPEITALALAMRDSGTVLDWAPLGLDDRRLVDKHSSGGVGDEKVTLLVVPLAAACGLHVPNLSGWGLDYCGGEMDMLESVPGFQSAPSPELFQRVVKEAGGAISGPTEDLAPADRTIFRVRDVTATVESVPLITGSIMSKKLAVAPRGLVVCVGSGSGAYMASIAEARRLASAMSAVAAGAGVPSVMVLTDMDSVLGTSVGAAVQMVETVDFLTGRYRDPRTLDLVLDLVAEMAAMGGVAADKAAGLALARARLEDGSAAERFGRLIAGQGGPADFMADPARHLPKAAVIRPVSPTTPGYVAGMDAKAIGLALVEMGGGRKLPDEPIDHAVGFTGFVQIGGHVEADRPICTLHARDEASWQAAAERLRAALRVQDSPAPPAGPVVLERIVRAAD